MKNYVEVKNRKDLIQILGLSEAAGVRAKLRVQLVIGIRNALMRQKLTQMQGAEMAHVGRTVITAIVNGNLSKISTDRLLEIADRLGVKMQFKVA